MTTHPVLLAGGFGTRLWPLSRKHFPKQFLGWGNDRSLLEQAISSLNTAELASPFIVCSQEHEAIVREQCAKVDSAHGKFLLEPIPLGTAGAVALAAMRREFNGRDTLMLVMPVDSYFEEFGSFVEVVESVTTIAKQGQMVMFGVPPRSANTNYGYIRFDNTVQIYQLDTLDKGLAIRFNLSHANRIATSSERCCRVVQASCAQQRV